MNNPDENREEQDEESLRQILEGLPYFTDEQRARYKTILYTPFEERALEEHLEMNGLLLIGAGFQQTTIDRFIQLIAKHPFERTAEEKEFVYRVAMTSRQGEPAENVKLEQAIEEEPKFRALLVEFDNLIFSPPFQADRFPPEVQSALAKVQQELNDYTSDDEEPKEYEPDNKPDDEIDFF